MKLIEENISRTDFHINHRNICFDPSPIIMKIKTKINIWSLIELKSLCTEKETINKVKREPSNGRKYLQKKQLTRD